MAQWLICPYWVGEKRRLRDEADRTYQIDYQGTEIWVTNPTDLEGIVDLVFYEQRGDGNFYLSDWANGRWTVPGMYQTHYRPDASRRFGDWFIIYGWFEIWMNLDEMVMDIEIWRLSRNMIGGGAGEGAGGLVGNISQRTIQPVKKRIPLSVRIPDFVRPPRPPAHFPAEPPRILAPGGGGIGPPVPGP
jgi:hypothetical protein